MPEDKKINIENLPRPEKEDTQHQNQEEFDDKTKEIKEKTKSRKSNFKIRDLPIY